jgi:hypothetical protein
VITDKERDVLGLLARHEVVIAALYGTFGRVLPDMADFWNTLVAEERAHGDVIRALMAKLETGSVLMKPRRVSVATLEAALASVEKEIRLAKASGVTAVQALSVALSFEQGMLEKGFFEVFEADGAEMKEEFCALQAHTTEHAARIGERLNRERAAQGGGSPLGDAAAFQP